MSRKFILCQSCKLLAAIAVLASRQIPRLKSLGFLRPPGYLVPSLKHFCWRKFFVHAPLAIVEVGVCLGRVVVGGLGCLINRDKTKNAELCQLETALRWNQA